MAQGPVTLHRDELHKGFIDLDKNELRNLRLQNLGADISTPVNGLLFLRTDTNKVRARINGAWVDMATTDDITAGAISASIVDAKGDLIVATAADTVVRKAAGTNGHALFADSAQADGLVWRAIASGDVSGLGALATLSTVGTAQIDNDAVTYAKIQNVTTDRLLGRDTAASGDVEEITVTGGIEWSGTGSIRTSAFTGDVTKTAGGTALTIANDAVTNAKLANMAANSIKGNNTGGSADPADLTAAQVKTLLAIVPGDITGFDTQVRTSRLDQMAAPTADVSLNNRKITNLADGTASTDAATFGQLNSVLEGRKWKEPVRAATTVAGTLATSFENTDTIDGVVLATGDRILIKNQAAAAENGIYTVNASGAPTRAADANTAGEVSKATVMVQEGTVNQGDVFTSNTITTLGTDAITFTQTGEGNTAYTADGTTVELVGNSFRIAATAAGNGLTGGGGSALAVSTGAGLEISGDAVRIAAAAAGNGLTGGAGSALAVGAGTGITVNADDVAIDTSVVVRKATGALTGGTNSEVITHNLNTRDIASVQLVNATSPYDALGEVYWEATTVNTLTVYAGSGLNLPAGYRYIVTA